MSQEEFGFAGDDGRITLTCDASVTEYVMCLISRDASEEVERDRMPRPAEVGLHVAASGGTAEEVGVSVDAAVLEREACGARLGGDGVLLAAEGEACDDVAVLEDGGGVAEDELDTDKL
ncbi:hypothetical protein OsI_35264 [Oryza sativa Indica Group]|uniref:Uncharacterized protein n=1 Tax=Oryza sativa subsp. indica TaxID=39946 RepID=B8BJB2_ORYSI|nr:hypothetical protein OsI_35264 [Oryza sativa Indica Group]